MLSVYQVVLCLSPLLGIVEQPPHLLAQAGTFPGRQVLEI